MPYRLIIFALALIAFSSLIPAIAAEPSNCLSEDTQEWEFELDLPLFGLPLSTDGLQILAWLFVAGLILAAVLALMMLAINGLRYIAAAGNSSQQGDAKQKITNAILGLILALASVLLLFTINPQLTKVFLPNLPIPGDYVDPGCEENQTPPGPMCTPNENSCTNDGQCCSNNCSQNATAGDFCCPPGQNKPHLAKNSAGNCVQQNSCGVTDPSCLSSNPAFYWCTDENTCTTGISCPFQDKSKCFAANSLCLAAAPSNCPKPMPSSCATLDAACPGTACRDRNSGEPICIQDQSGRPITPWTVECTKPPLLGSYSGGARWTCDLPAGVSCPGAPCPLSSTLAQCANNRDDDGDNLIDFGTNPTNDPGCSASNDNDESNVSPPSCANECSPSGTQSCASSASVKICGNYDQDSCLEWSTPNSCPSGEQCAGGTCVTPSPNPPSESELNNYCIANGGTPGTFSSGAIAGCIWQCAVVSPPTACEKTPQAANIRTGWCSICEASIGWGCWTYSAAPMSSNGFTNECRKL